MTSLQGLVRLLDWDVRLVAYLDGARARQFKTCLHFCGGALEAMTGTNPLDGVGFETPIGALRHYRRAMVSKEAFKIEALAKEILGQRQPPARLRRGDLAVLRIGSKADDWVFGVVEQGGAFVVDGQMTNPALWDLSFVKFGWRIA